MVSADGSVAWYFNGKRHRTDGPATERANGTKEWWINGWVISGAYSHVLTAAYDRGLPIPPEVLPDILKAMLQALNPGEQTVRLNIILNKYWPIDVKKILATLFSDSDPDIKHLAFSLLGHRTAAAHSPTPRAHVAHT